MLKKISNFQGVTTTIVITTWCRAGVRKRRFQQYATIAHSEAGEKGDPEHKCCGEVTKTIYQSVIVSLLFSFIFTYLSLFITFYNRSYRLSTYRYLFLIIAYILFQLIVFQRISLYIARIVLFFIIAHIVFHTFHY